MIVQQNSVICTDLSTLRLCLIAYTVVYEGRRRAEVLVTNMLTKFESNSRQHGKHRPIGNCTWSNFVP